MSHRKQPERRSFSQDRYDILIKRQKDGRATFNELTELDEIVNRDPDIRERVLLESLLMNSDDTPDNSENGAPVLPPPVRSVSLAERAREFLGRLFNLHIGGMRYRVLILVKSNIALL